MAAVCPNELNSSSPSPSRLSPCAQTVYNRLRALAKKQSGPELTSAQSRITALAGDRFIGTCYVFARSLGRGPKRDPNARQFRLRNVQVALADLQAVGLAVRYASGPNRSVGWAVFREPSIDFAAAIWEEAPPEFKRRLCAAGVALPPGYERYAGSPLAEDAHLQPDPPIWRDENGDEFSEHWPDAKLSQLALELLDRMKRLCRSRRKKVAAPLTVPQTVALGEAAEMLFGRCWASIRSLSFAADATAGREYAERAVQVALRALEIKGLILPYAVGPLASTCFLVFDVAQSQIVQDRMWAAASDTFIKRMGRSRYVDQAKDDQEIGVHSYSVRVKSEQHTSGAAASSSFAHREAEVVPPTGNMSDSTDGAPAQALQPEGGFPLHAASAEQFFANLRLWGANDACVEAASRVAQLAERARSGLIPVERYLASTTKPLLEALRYCEAHLRAIVAKPIRPRVPAAYLSAALANNYNLPREALEPKKARPAVEKLAEGDNPEPNITAVPAKLAKPAALTVAEDLKNLTSGCATFDRLVIDAIGGRDQWPYWHSVTVQELGKLLRVGVRAPAGDFVRQFIDADLSRISASAHTLGYEISVFTEPVQS